MQEDRELAAALNAAAIHFLRRLAREDAASGVGPTQLSVLSLLVYAGSQRISDLSRRERVSVPTMSKVVRGLEVAGLALRRDDPHDGRVSWIQATDAGRQSLEEARRARLDLLEGRLARLRGDQKATLKAGVALLEQLAATDES